MKTILSCAAVAALPSCEREKYEVVHRPRNLNGSTWSAIPRVPGSITLSFFTLLFDEQMINFVLNNQNCFSTACFNQNTI